MRRPALPAALVADAWRERRRTLTLVLAIQAVVLVVFTVTTDASLLGLLLDWTPLAAGVLLIVGWRASDRRLRNEAEEYLAIAGALLVAIDADGTIRMVNRRLCEIAGHPAEALIGRRYSTALAHADEVLASKDTLEALLNGDQDLVKGIERRLVTAAGAVRIVEWDVAIRRDSRGNGIGLLCSGDDVTDRRRQEAQLALQQRDLAGLRRLAQAVARSEDARQEIVEVVRELAGADFATLVEQVGPTMLQTTFSTDPVVNGYEMPLYGGRPSGSRDAFVSGLPGFHAETADSPRVNPEMVRRTGARSVMFQPVIVDGSPAAVLVVGWRHKVPTVGSRERELVGLASDEAALALQRLATHRRLEALALTDPLTGVPNRRAFDERLPLELSSARRSDAPLAVAMLDLNDFKALNDREGHEAGDDVLRATAAAWAAELRDTDTLARLGGDEFAVLLPDCGATEAAAVAHRLRRAVPHGPGSGVGIVVWNRHESAAALLARADRALYEDKGGASVSTLRRLSDRGAAGRRVRGAVA